MPPLPPPPYVPRLPTTIIAASGANVALAFAANGDCAYDVTLSANCTFTLSGGTAGQYQRLTLIVREPATGTVWTTSLPTGPKYAGGSAPAGPTALGQALVVAFGTTDGSATIFGGV